VRRRQKYFARLGEKLNSRRQGQKKPRAKEARRQGTAPTPKPPRPDLSRSRRSPSCCAGTSIVEWGSATRPTGYMAGALPLADEFGFPGAASSNHAGLRPTDPRRAGSRESVGGGRHVGRLVGVQRWEGPTNGIPEKPRLINGGKAGRAAMHPTRPSAIPRS